MAVNYQKLYAYLVGEIDDTLQLIARDLTDERCTEQGFIRIVEIGEKLRNALTTAEDTVLDSTEM